MAQIKDEIRLYTPAIALDRFFPKVARKVLTIVIAIAFLAVVVVILVQVLFAAFTQDGFSYGMLFSELSLYTGLLFILFGSLSSLLLLNFFYQSLYLRGIETIVHEGIAKEGGITFESAVVLRRDANDLTMSFITSPYGLNTMRRCSISDSDIEIYLSSERDVISSSSLVIPEHSFLTLLEIGRYLFRNDSSFSKFLFKHGVSEEIYFGAMGWIMRIYHESKHQKRWWSRDNLGKTNGIGREFSFGIAYELREYIRDIKTTAVFSVLTKDTAYGDEKVEQIEAVLVRTKEANVLLIGEAGVGKMDVLVRLGQKIHNGKSTGSIMGKRLVVFDDKSFLATHESKETFEPAFIKLLSQAERAGNIIIVFENIAQFFQSAASIGVDVADLIDDYLLSSDVQVIGTSDPMSYHQHLETRPQIIQRFETVLIDDPDHSSIMRVLEDVALTHEILSKLTFTYQSIQTIAESADQYIVEGVMPDKAVDLLVEIVPSAEGKGVHLITKEFVEKYVSGKTGIPIGPITKEEKNKLLHLEDELHTKVIGQESAITAISGAMRRSRAGIQAKDKPIGSFLFLGPTGVGKTETAKALAGVFFGDESKMLRLDMSEFNGPGGLPRLMGDGNSSGVLGDMLRSHPYGVLLLDEFEKASADVHDLFLQILDEGMYTDARGGKVNARNTIIIATSNAGSQLMWDMVKEGINPTEKKNDLISEIVNAGVYKPELINRFDGVIIFEPLKLKDREKIAALMLGELKERIKKKGFELEVSDVLVKVLTTKGYNPEFGAREMRRILQDVVEEKIASKIIAGNLKLGDKIVFIEEDFMDRD